MTRLIIALLLKVVDIGTTAFVVSEIGTRAEVNPIMKFAMNNLGLNWTLILSMMLYSVVVLFAYKVKQMMVINLSIVIMSIVAIINIISVIGITL